MRLIFAPLFLYFGILLSNAQSKEWVVVMSQGSGHNGQSMVTRTAFPAKEMEGNWNNGKAVTSLDHGDGLWVLIASKVPDTGKQIYFTSSDFPGSKVQENWRKGYKLKEMVYGDRQWSAIMSQRLPYRSQAYFFRKSFPKEAIQKCFGEGKRISDLTFGNGQWAVVLSENTGYASQQVITSKDFPKERIDEFWRQGFQITELCRGGGLWTVVMSKGSSITSQQLLMGKPFPSGQIKDLWEKRYRVTSVAFGGEYVPESPIVVTTRKSIPKKEIPKENIPKKPSKKSETYILAVGIANYSQAPRLNYTDDDAHRLGLFFKSPEGGAIGEDHIKVLVNEEATLQNVRDGLEQFAKKADEDDVVIFYFSGHGKADLLIPYEYNGKGPHISHYEVKRILSSSKAKQKLFIADMVHSSIIASQNKDISKISPQNYYHAFSGANPNIALMLSYKSSETPTRKGPKVQGLYNYYLIQGLKGSADSNADLRVSLGEIQQYLEQDLKDSKDDQKLHLLGTYDEDVPLIHLAGE